MKPFLIVLTLVTLSLSVYFTYDRYNRVGVSTMRMFDGNNEQYLSSKGKIVFNEDETGIASMPVTGFLKYENNSVKFKADAKSGKIVYQLSEDGSVVDLNTQYGKILLAETIKEIIETGFDARGRMERLYQSGGSEAVLTAATKLKHDNMKAMYYQYLVDETKVTDTVLLDIITRTGKIGGDFEKSKILRAISGQIKDTTLAAAYFKSVDGIDNDFEKSGVLEEMIKNDLDSTNFYGILKVTSGIHSEFEKSKVLKKLVKEGGLNSAKASSILTAAQSVNADFEKGNILEMFSTELTNPSTALSYLSVVKVMDADFEKVKALDRVIKQPMSDTVFNEVLQITGSINADHERSGIIKKLLDRNTDPGIHFNKMLLLIHDMDGEFERTNLLQNVAEKHLTSDDQWTSLIAEASFLSNDSEKAKLLTYMAAKMPRNEQVKEAYEKSAKTINSEFEYGKTLKAAAF